MNNSLIRFNFKKIMATFLMLAFTVPMFAFVEGDEVEYIGGTVATVAPGTVGKLDTTNEKDLRFVAGSASISIPYAKIDSYQYSKELAYHYGVLPTVAIVMVKHRRRRHYFRISYHDENNKAQSVVLEVSKDMPKAVNAVLDARAPKPGIGKKSGSSDTEQAKSSGVQTNAAVVSQAGHIEVAAK